MSDPRAPRIARRHPSWKRGRSGRLLGGLWEYTRTAWWGIVSARVLESDPLVVAQAVILREAATPEVLLTVRSDLLGWELPGGTVEHDEAVIQAVIREVREETGLDVEPVTQVGTWVRRGFRPHTAHVYLCRVVSGSETPSHETPRLEWFAVDSLPRELFPWYHEPLQCALEPGERPFEGDDWQGPRVIWETMKIDLAMRWRGLPPPGSH